MHINATMFDVLLIFGEHSKMHPTGMAALKDCQIGKLNAACLRLKKLGLVDDIYIIDENQDFSRTRQRIRLFFLTSVGHEAMELTRQFKDLLRRAAHVERELAR